MSLLKTAKEAGFDAKILKPEQIPINPGYRMFCIENKCGKCGANYGCPPDCGELESLQQMLTANNTVLVVSAQWKINGYEDTPAIANAMQMQNEALMYLMGRIREDGLDGFAVGYNGCPLCKPCKRIQDEPCPFPKKQVHCMSAHGVDVSKLAQLCHMEYAWEPCKLYLFGMIAFTQVDTGST